MHPESRKQKTRNPFNILLKLANISREELYEGELLLKDASRFDEDASRNGEMKPASRCLSDFYELFTKLGQTTVGRAKSANLMSRNPEDGSKHCDRN